MKVLRVTAKKPGFRRAGINHPATAVDHPDGSLTEDQIQLILGEPMLVAAWVEVPEKDVPEKAGSRKTGTDTKPTEA